MAANPIQGGAQVIAKQSGNRKTALALIIAIAATEVILSGKGRTFWSALWGATHPLSSASNGSTSGVHAPTVRPTKPGDPSSGSPIFGNSNNYT